MIDSTRGVVKNYPEKPLKETAPCILKMFHHFCLSFRLRLCFAILHIEMGRDSEIHFQKLVKYLFCLNFIEFLYSLFACIKITQLK